MIVNPNATATLQADWQGVLRMRERMQHLVVSTFAFDPITSPVFGNILFNLPLQLALNVLAKVLLQAREGGQFAGRGCELENLLDGARASLLWIDWQALREGAQRGSELAHDGRLFGDRQCLQDIAHIEAQLFAWGVIRTTETSSV